MGKIILIGATKGGVGKTVSTYNLAYSLASMGKKVLAVDFDSQANLTTCFGVEDTWAISTTIGHLMMLQLDDEELPDLNEYLMSRNGVDFIPSSMVLSAVDAKLRMEMGAERMLANILEPLRDRYDYLIVGAGLYGAVMAYELGKQGKSCRAATAEAIWLSVGPAPEETASKSSSLQRAKSSAEACPAFCR